MANTNEIKEKIEPHIRKQFIKNIDAQIIEIKIILEMQPDVVAIKGNTLIIGEITTSGYLGGMKNNYHQGGIKKINEAFAKFSLLINMKEQLFRIIEDIIKIKVMNLECYFIVPENSKFLSQIGYRKKLFTLGVMKLFETNLPVEIQQLLETILLNCRKEMK